MENEIILAIIQAITEFLPISSSGHLALAGKFLGDVNLFLITFLHLASLLAVLIFTRKEIFKLLSFKKEFNKVWIYLVVATIPATIVGYFLREFIEQSLNSLLFIGISFIFTGMILLLTRFTIRDDELNSKNALIIGLFQALAVFPGVSRSGMTISSALFLGIKKEQAVKFSFLLFIPVSIGAFILEFGNFYFDTSLAIAFVLCFILSLLFLHVLNYIVKKGSFWLFSIYCFIMGAITIYLNFI